MLATLRKFLKQSASYALPKVLFEIRRQSADQKKVFQLYLKKKVFHRKVIFIKRKGNLGDVICTFPLVRHLRKQCRSAIIIYECLPWNMDFPKLCADVDLVVGEGSELAEFCMNYFRPEEIYEPMMSDECAPRKKSQSMHIVDEMAYSVGIDKLEEKQIRVSFSKMALDQCSRLIETFGLGNKNFAVVHMGPTWNVREWSIGKWESLVEILNHQLGLQIIQVGTEFVSSSGGRPTPRIPGCHDWVGKISIEETAALLSRARIFVGIDSGILHLAGGVGVPCVGIFGSTLSEMRLPRERVAIGLNSSVPCRGCHHATEGPLHWQTGCPNNIQCMAQLHVDDVYAACVEVLRIADGRRHASIN
jgi:ADP-heptose:LPS heptosyltransferase